MSYMLRDRSDGQVEIILSKPILIGIFPERDVAQRVCSLLQEEAVDWPEEQPAGFATAAADVAEAEREALSEVVEVLPGWRKSRARTVRNLPVVVPEKPVAPVFLTPMAPELTDAQRDIAFRRIAEGEKLGAVAASFGLPMGVLRGMWGNHKRQMQKHLSEGGKIACQTCQRPFVPSISNPDTCARCSHG
ncbi:hypothetical protein [Tabrizicola fusiformis]|uniref:hypothetical protein n=1 Tax=Tabrizicola sp. SY72 TaxID=2741673 RepID=UPI0015716D92|nr:hypothetical protein [Tabrizicola sp. SY72]NTT88245.1 hypothetical protein [Tabrizicola sp. SY72]